MATYSGSDKRIKYLFENGGGGGSSSLAGLDDVNLSSPTDGQVLKYDATNDEWVNGEGGGSGGASLGTGWILYKTQTGSVAVDISEIYDKATEFYVVAKASGSNSDTLNSLITRNAIENGLDRLGLGGDPNIALVEVSSTAFQLTYMKWGSVVTDNSVLEIYYKTAEAVVAPIIYSQEEQEVGVWEDGKPLYQKTYAGLSLDCPTANTWYNTNILLGDIDVITSAELIDDNRQYIAGVVGTMLERTYLGVYLPISGRTITTITIQYTKTTDTAGSGSWTPSGAPAVHYSTNEQVVGTDENGNTVYERVVIVPNAVSIPQSSWTTFYTDAFIGDISQIIDARYLNPNNKGVFPVFAYRPSENNLQVYTWAGGGFSFAAGAKIILQYTKSS